MNTCTIDNLLLGLWVSTIINCNLLDIIQTNPVKIPFQTEIIEIVQQINKKDWNKAKSIWILNVLSLKSYCLCQCEDSECDDDSCKPLCDCQYDIHCDDITDILTYGNEYEFF